MQQPIGRPGAAWWMGWAAALVVSVGCGQTLSSPQAEAPSEAPGVMPSVETIADGSYSPLSRTIYIYARKSTLTRPEVAAFVLDYVKNSRAYAEQVGYIPLPQPEVDAEVQKLTAELDKLGVKPTAGGSLKGQIVVDGSSTVGPESKAAADEFQKVHLGVTITVGISGTGGGFRMFGNNELDVTGASRTIKPDEAEVCKKNNVEYVELRVGLDGITVVVNPRNTWCRSLTTAQLKSMWERGSKINRWKDLDPSWPDEPLELFGADRDSGTFDFFNEAVLGKTEVRGDYRDAVHDEIIQAGVVNNQYALGYFGFAYYEQKKLLLNAVKIVDAK